MWPESRSTDNYEGWMAEVVSPIYSYFLDLIEIWWDDGEWAKEKELG